MISHSTAPRFISCPRAARPHRDGPDPQSDPRRTWVYLTTSIAYIAGARSMLAGDGYREAWLASNGPVTHFPPAFSSILAFFGIFGLDPLRAARWVNASLFGLNTWLLGILGWRMTRSLTAGLVLAALFVASGEMFQVHAAAMSEPLFIFLTLLAFWMFDLYFERDQHWLWLVACGIFVGLAYLTRYAGLAWWRRSSSLC